MGVSHRLTEYIGNTVKELELEEIETYELTPITKRPENVEKLYSVVLVMQPQLNHLNNLLYGLVTVHGNK